MELGTPEENAKNAPFSESMVSSELQPIRGRDPLLLHNLLKESLPCHTKLETDREFRYGRTPKHVAARKSVLVNTDKDEGLLSAKLGGMSAKLLVIDENSSEPARARAIRTLDAKPKQPLSSVNLVPFDYGCLVQEKKGSIYDEYRVTDILGRGSFGEVKKVAHRISGKACAMKILNKRCCSGNANIMNEIDILKKLDHPNIVRLYEFAQDSRCFYLITEYCAGGELLNKIMSLKSFSEQSAAKIMRQLLSAVAYCHSRNIVHRDLKPENLVLESDDIESNVKVIDFGTSAVFKPTEKLRDVTGTAFYIAPEVIKGHYTEKCDIWSCGVVMYVLLSGNPPFYGRSNEEVMKKVEKGNVTFLSSQWKNVSQDAINLIKRMLTYRPENRITAEEALSNIWIMKYAHSERVEAGSVLESLSLLKQFKAQANLLKAVLSYVSGQCYSVEQEKKARQVFGMLDKNGDGQLSKEELLGGYRLLMAGGMEMAKKDVEEIMDQLDINRNGTIDYKEFLMANFKQADMMNQKMLKQAFNFFDADGNGQISKDEIKRVFSMVQGDSVIGAILDDADTNHDEQISFDEFVEVMKKYMKDNISPAGSTVLSSMCQP